MGDRNREDIMDVKKRGKREGERKETVERKMEMTGERKGGNQGEEGKRRGGSRER